MEGVVDLVRMKGIYFDGPKGEIVREEEVPSNLLEEATTRREALITSLADVDDEIADLFIMEEEPTVDQIKAVSVFILFYLFWFGWGVVVVSGGGCGG